MVPEQWEFLQTCRKTCRSIHPGAHLACIQEAVYVSRRWVPILLFLQPERIQIHASSTPATSLMTLLPTESSGLPMAQAMPQTAAAKVERAAADRQRRVDPQHSRSARISDRNRGGRTTEPPVAMAIRLQRQQQRQEFPDTTTAAATAAVRKPIAAKATPVAQTGSTVTAPSLSTQPAPRRVTSTGQNTMPAVSARMPETAVVQLRLSSTLVKVITGLSKAGQKPCHLIEQILWEDRRICDAAAILRLRRIIPRRKATTTASLHR